MSTSYSLLTEDMYHKREKGGGEKEGEGKEECEGRGE